MAPSSASLSNNALIFSFRALLPGGLGEWRMSNTLGGKRARTVNGAGNSFADLTDRLISVPILQTGPHIALFVLIMGLRPFGDKPVESGADKAVFHSK